jgi:beta-N-acetylhexosaminidase
MHGTVAGMDRWSGRSLSRRGFLIGLGAGLVGLLAACSRWFARSTPVASGVPGASSVSSPSLGPTPGETGPALRTKIGQMLLVGFRGTTAESAQSVLADIRDRALGGVVLFSFDQPTGSPVRNVESQAQLSALDAALQSAAAELGRPLTIAIDEEGGEVARLGPDHGFPATESAAALGQRDDPAYTRAAGRRIADTLGACRINFNLAPVVDLDLNPDNPIIGALDRSFSADPAVVIRQAEAFITGHHDRGVLTCLKHFPGHGSATGDTHLGVVDVTGTWSEVELIPFTVIIADGLADAVLTAHIFNADLDPRHPATLSHATIDGILRARLGYYGVVFSDDMQMGAIRDAYGYPDAVELAINAGVDVLTIANQQVFEPGILARTIDIVVRAVREGRISEARIDEAWQRIADFKSRLA